MKPSLGASEIVLVPRPFVNSKFYCSLLFSITFVSKYDYEFLICVLRKMKLRVGKL